MMKNEDKPYHLAVFPKLQSKQPGLCFEFKFYQKPHFSKLVKQTIASLIFYDFKNIMIYCLFFNIQNLKQKPNIVFKLLLLLLQFLYYVIPQVCKLISPLCAVICITNVYRVCPCPRSPRQRIGITKQPASLLDCKHKIDRFAIEKASTSISSLTSLTCWEILKTSFSGPMGV